MRTITVLAIAACGHATTPTSIPAAEPTTAPELVQIDTGTIRGVNLATTLAWRGIPYATPPIGVLRWQPPQLPAPWSGVRETTGFGYACMQAGTSSAPNDSAMGSEDCLTLNVWRPLGASADGNRPVMVFVHGGYFTWGSSSYRKNGVDLYDGAQLAARGDAVVVTLNYRLGPFGFLAVPGVRDANFGLLDQIAALQWVQRNISAFGGDPRHVTLFGQSAGAISSAALYASPLARGLFAAVIMHSGNGDAKSRADAERAGVLLAKHVGCERAMPADTLACLRARSPTAIASALPESFAPAGYKFGPIVDGIVLPKRPIELVEAGEHAHMPLVVATTSNEFSTMIEHYVDGSIATADDYAAMIGRRFPRVARVLLGEYPAASYATPLAAYNALMSDAFSCQAELFAAAAAAHQREPVYRFVFDHGYSGKLAAFGAGHGMDLYMLFHDLPSYITFDADEQALSDQLVAAWSRFAHTGALDWPVVGSGAIETLDHALHTATPADHCAFWQPLLQRR